MVCLPGSVIQANTGQSLGYREGGPNLAASVLALKRLPAMAEDLFAC